MPARRLLALILLLTIGACASFPDAPPASVAPTLGDDAVVSLDGAALGLKVWRAEDTRAVVVALHGMNDYAHAFALPGAWWAAHANITTYAYDQRGFGRSPDFGRWPGSATLVADLNAVVAAARARHPDTPLFVAGHSMGGAVVLAAMKAGALDVDGVILAAPGVWGGAKMPLLYRATLNLAAGLAPGKKLTGERAQRQATDNIPLVREMIADPLVIKDTRLDAVLGVVRLMGEAWDATDETGGRILVLVGEKDEIIPPKHIRAAAGRLCGAVTVRTYPEGWHLLFRDLGGATPTREAAAWIQDATNDRGPVGGAAGPRSVVCPSARLGWGGAGGVIAAARPAMDG